MTTKREAKPFWPDRAYLLFTFSTPADSASASASASADADTNAVFLFICLIFFILPFRF